MQVTVEHLDELAAVFRTGWDRRVLERRSAPVLRAFDRMQPGGRQEDFIDFFDGVVRQVASGLARTSSAAVGAILWYESQVRLSEEALGPLLHPDRLSELLNDPAWPALADQWQRRYGFPATHQREIFRVGRSQAYDYLRQGKVRIAEVLNGPLMARDQVRMTEAQGWSKISRALHHWYEHGPGLGDQDLTAVYVPPTLQRILHTQHTAPIGSEETLIEWLDQDRIVLITGDAGGGKSTLLRYLGGLMLEQNCLPVWLEPGADVASSEDLMTRLIEQTGVVYSGVHQTLLLAVQSKRLQLLVDGGETWTQFQVHALLALRARLDAGLIVAARHPQHWGEVEHERVEIVWTPRALHEVMARRGQTQLWPTLSALLNTQRLMLRPWEFVQAAQVSLETLASPVTLLEAALQAQIETHGITSKTLNALLAAAWQTVTQTRVHWRPVHASDKSKANQAVEARLMLKDHDGYRFAHDLWRDFLAARYAARQPSAREVVNDLIGLADWPQILAWAVQSAWDDGRPEWATEALQALTDNLTNTWRQSGWLQGALVFAALPLPLKAKEKVKAIRATVERTLIERSVRDWLRDPDGTTRSIVGEALGNSLLAISPLSGEAVDTLWLELFVQRSHEFMEPLIEALLREPGIVQCVLNTPLDLPHKQSYHYVEVLAQAPGLQPEELIAHVQRSFPGGAEQFMAVVAGLVAQGTPAAASALVSYLSEWRDDATLARADRLEPFLRNWPGETDVLWLKAARLFNQGVSPLIAQHFVRGLFAADSSGATRLDMAQRDAIQRLIEQTPRDLSEDQRVVIEQLEREREYYLMQQRLTVAEPEMTVPREEDIPTLLQGLLEEYALENVELLHQFSHETIDAVLNQQLLRRSQADQLTRLGTPYALQQLLSWSHVQPSWRLGVDVRYPSPRYRDAIWPLLAQAAEVESNDLQRYHLLSAIDILWLKSSAWPWPLVEFFFAHLTDQDQVVADKYRDSLLRKIAGRPLSAAWSGLTESEQAAYAVGLTRYALTGNLAGRMIALRFLSNMPTDLAGHGLTSDNLNQLLDDPDEWVVAEALDYVATHGRRDLLPRVRLMAQDDRLRKLSPKLQPSVAGTLSKIGEAEDGPRLLQITREAGSRWAVVSQLIAQRRYWPALHAAIERGEAEANWLMVAMVRQDVILVVEEWGELNVRQGAIGG